MKEGLVFDVQKFAIHDGPGIRTTVFLKGCPLRCWWCQNPEGQDAKPELAYRKNRCIGCGECTKKCPRTALSLVQHQISADRKKCLPCESCSLACPSDALSVVGNWTGARALMKEIEEDAAFYDESRGGVTFSGGEPLLQSAFLDAVLADCREQRIHTVVETCGFAPYKTISRICDKVDLFLYDIKIMDTGKHRKYTGVPNERILTNLKKLAQDRSDVVISFPIVPRINDNEENIVATAEFVRSLPDVKSVNLLPYHRGGVEKYRSLGRTYGLDGIQPPSTYRMKRIKEKLETFGIRAEVGGE